MQFSALFLSIKNIFLGVLTLQKLPKIARKYPKRAQANCLKLSEDCPNSLGLRSWRPSKEVPKPGPGKVPKKCFGKCWSEAGCRGKCRKKCSGSRFLYYLYIGAEPEALFFSALSSAPRFGPALSEALFRHFSWPGLRHFFRWLPGS